MKKWNDKLDHNKTANSSIWLYFSLIVNHGSWFIIEFFFFLFFWCLCFKLELKRDLCPLPLFILAVVQRVTSEFVPKRHLGYKAYLRRPFGSGVYLWVQTHNVRKQSHFINLCVYSMTLHANLRAWKVIEYSIVST